MSVESTVLEDAPKLYYRFNEAEGTSAADASGNALTGTHKNTPTLGVAGLLAGDADKAVKYTEANEETERAHNALLNVGDTFTFEAWIKLTATGDRCICYKLGAGSTTAKLAIAEGKLLLRVPGVANIATGKTTLEAGKTYHVVAVKSGATRKLYLNGVDDTGAVEEFTCANNAGTLHIGVEEPGEGENFNGVIDEFAYYGTALSEARVKAHYEAGAVQSTTIEPPAAVAKAIAPAPAVEAAQNVTVEPPAAVAIAIAPAPTVEALSVTTVEPPAAVAKAVALAPTIETTQNVTVEAPAAVAKAIAPPPSVEATAPVITRIAVTQEYPSDKLAWRIDPPNGAPSRWAADEPLAENVCEDIQLNDEMPGGDKEGTCVLARDPRTSWPDLSPYSDISVYGPGVEEVGHYRLDKAPETDGDRKAISPAAVGWRAALEDDNAMLGPGFINGDQGAWSGMSATRKLALLNAKFTIDDVTSETDPTTAEPALRLSIRDAWPTAAAAEALFDSGSGVNAERIMWERVSKSNSGPEEPQAGFVFDVGVAADSALATGIGISEDQHTANADTDPAGSTFTASVPARFAFMQWIFGAPGGGAGFQWDSYIRHLKVIADHGLTLQGTWPEVGFTVSQMLAYAIPLFTELTADPEDLEDSGYVIGHAWFADPGPMTQVVQELTKYDLLDWFVFGGKRFQMKFPGTYGHKWQAYVGPSGLEEQGLDASRLWRSIVVSYQDVDGTTRTVGPPGSGATIEEPGLEITDPDHPAVRAGITRKDLLSLNGISTAARATEAGERWLAEANLLPRSGNCTLSGYVMDDRGIYRPVSQVRAGDTIRFPDSGDTSYRKVVTRSYSHTTRTASLALDAPSGGIAALLERLQADIQSLQLA